MDSFQVGLEIDSGGASAQGSTELEHISKEGPEGDPDTPRPARPLGETGANPADGVWQDTTHEINMMGNDTLMPMRMLAQSWRQGEAPASGGRGR